MHLETSLKRTKIVERLERILNGVARDLAKAGRALTCAFPHFAAMQLRSYRCEHVVVCDSSQERIVRHFSARPHDTHARGRNPVILAAWEWDGGNWVVPEPAEKEVEVAPTPKVSTRTKKAKRVSVPAL